MSKVLTSAILFIVIAVLLNGCDRTRTLSADSGKTAYPSVTDDKVPTPIITAEGSGDEIPSEQRSYCWGKLGCADYIGGMQGMEETPPALIRPGEQISVVFPYQQQPVQMNLVRFTGDGQTQIAMIGNFFTAPLEDGVYYYGVSAFWKTEDGLYSTGDTSCVFKIRVTSGNH
ncbi:hypothetical protein [Paenibacillus rhizophilus]|uniref:Uncharacterized protein n=1 Tax=Paenibacillus rhizophilus TaxID=1850366 RepID=A0A3N9Q2G2_9BACL|nr:hypothetical protein [Paenibacillus rhizophilus]RQW11706.1 hypothetical protein EH198_11905 [Paenibacillus rhizophilus]